METIKIDSTKRGFPAMWESGGGMTSGGSATVVTGRQGEALRPVYIRRGGHLACGDHALICVHEGYYFVRAGVARGTRSSASVWRIASTSVKDIDGERWEASANVELVNAFSKGEWDRPLDPKFEKAVEAAFRKAACYHCRSAFYIDTSERPTVSGAEHGRRDEERRQQDAARAALRQAKADRETAVRAQAEAESRQAKAAGLGARLEAANARLVALGAEPAKLGETLFEWCWQQRHYTEASVAAVEAHVKGLEEQRAAAERQRVAREAFKPQFEAFLPRATAAGIAIEFADDCVRVGGGHYGKPYSAEGLAAFTAELDRGEKETAEARAKADAEAEYQRRKLEAVALGLPTDIRIWRRRGGRTNAGDGWVIGPGGEDRPNTGWTDPTSRRLARYGEGEMIWEQVLPGELVLRWKKACSAAEHVFEVVYLPPGGLTEAQLERVAEIEAELEREWEGAYGLASGRPSPPVGKGWGLKPSSPPPAPADEKTGEPVDLTKVDLSKLFGGGARVERRDTDKK